MEVKTFGPQINEANLSRNLKEKVDTFEPYMIREVLLLSPGDWNGLYFSADTIIEGYTNTDWTNRKNYELIYEHDTKAQNWVGYVINRRVTPNGEVFGDLEIYDEQLAINLGKGNAKLGISASMRGESDGRNYFIGGFKNFSVVSDPACKPALINLSEGNKVKLLESKDISLTKIYTEEERTQTVFITSTDGGHHHEYTKLDEITSMVNGHAHKLNLNAMIAEESDGHSHKLMNTEKNNLPINENIATEAPEKDVQDDSLLDLNSIEERKGDDKKSKMEMEKVLSESEKLSSSLDMILSKLDSLETKVNNLEKAKEELEEEDVVVEEEKPVEEEPVKEEADAELSQEPEVSESTTPAKEESPAAPVETPEPTPAPAAPVDTSAEELAKVKAELAALKAEKATPKKLEAKPVSLPSNNVIAMDKRSDLDKLIEGRLSRILKQ